MSGVQDGARLTLEVSDTADPSGWSTMGGLVSTSVAFGRKAVDGSHLLSPGWRESVSGVGLATARIAGRGVFVGDNAVREVRRLFFENLATGWRITLPGLGQVQGEFGIERLEWTGPYGGEMQMSLTLTSAGELLFTEEQV